MGKRGRRIRAIVLGLVILVLIGVVIKSLTEDKPSKPREDETRKQPAVYKYTSQILNLRTGPANENDSIATIAKGEKVEILESLDGWDRVSYKDREGYANNTYLSKEEVVIDRSGDNEEEIKEPTFIDGVLLVNKEYGLPKNYYKGLDATAKGQMDKMIQTFKEETGLGLTIRSGFRANELQEKFYTNYVRVNGLEKASLYSAKPGHSEHEAGLAFDLCDVAGEHCLEASFEGTREGRWLYANSHKFGFILRYPKDKTDITGYAYEPWHFRYVGEDHAKVIYEKSLTLEEYLLPSEY